MIIVHDLMSQLVLLADFNHQLLNWDGIEVDPFPLDDNILGEEDISEAVLQLQLHRSKGPYGMRAKHLRMWLRAATREEEPDLGNW